jgi:hypothetical protein
MAIDGEMFGKGEESVLLKYRRKTKKRTFIGC